MPDFQPSTVTGRVRCSHWLTVGQVFRPLYRKWEILMARVEKNNSSKLGELYPKNGEMVLGSLKKNP